MRRVSIPFSSLLEETTMNLIKVSATSRTAAVAGAIAGIVREHHRAEIQAIGAGAVNQAVKALVVATGYLRLDGIHVRCVPEFADVTIEDKVRTAIKLVVEPGDAPNSSATDATDVTDMVRTVLKPIVKP
jgi:stage V sporulation protein S